MCIYININMDIYTYQYVDVHVYSMYISIHIHICTLILFLPYPPSHHIFFPVSIGNSAGKKVKKTQWQMLVYICVDVYIHILT